jgi:hypothetical protein
VRCKFIITFLLIFTFCLGELKAQSVTNIDNKILYRKEWSAYVLVHTGGWGLGYNNGKHKTGYLKRMWEVEFVSMKHPKEKKVSSLFENTRSYIYGKLNSFYIIRGSYGLQRILNGKPYWGGVELRWFFYGGLSVGITKPVYLYIVKFNETTHLNDVVIERYNPELHDVENIYGRGPYFKGFDHLKIYPGVFAKTGLNFEYGVNDKVLKAIECGAILDFYPLSAITMNSKPIQKLEIMAYDKSQPLFLSLYLSLHFGKRKN